ncbi:hypothetical protein [Kitasatospora sp. NPDC056800]|uniref:hypothetical protein n=1 Tax=Kitasatospora sp. NPDC056800 TaxID=3345948 RepID=UPI003688F6F0
MADDTTGTVLGFPGLTLPGVVGEDGPGDGMPTLAPLTTEFAPPASLSIPEAPVLGGETETAASGMEAAPAAGSGSLAGVASMSTVMMAGITVAALRGAYHTVEYLKARAEHHKAVRDQQGATTGKANTQLERARSAALAAQQPGRGQAGPEFGRGSRNSGSNSSPNSARMNGGTPSTFRSTGQSGPGGASQRRSETGRGAGQDGRPGPAGTTGPERVREARRRALEDSGRKRGPEGNSDDRKGRGNGGGNGGGNGPSDTSRDRLGRQPAGPDTIRGAARQRAAGRILNGPADKRQGPGPKDPADRRNKTDWKDKADRMDRPGRQPAGADTIRGAARRRAADRITTGTWKPTGAHGGDGATPATIRGALRKRAVDRILNGRKPKDPTDPGVTTETGATKPGTPGTELAVRPASAKAGDNAGTTSGDHAGNAASPGDGPTTGRRAKRLFTPGGATGSRPWRVRKPGTTAPGTTAPGSPADRKRRKHDEKQEHRARRARARAERAGASRARKGRQDDAEWREAYRRWRWDSWWRHYKKYIWPGSPFGDDGFDEGADPLGPRPGTQHYSWVCRCVDCSRTQPGETFGPPPGWVHSPGTTVRRADRPDPDADAPAIGRGQAALPRAPYNPPHARPGTTRPIPMPPAPPAPGGRPVTIPVPRAAHGTQYADADLTIYDVIEADADMAEEILAGADEARLAAEGCEKLLGRLEALHAKVTDLKVPGVLEGMVAALIEKAETVKAKAEAVAETIPAASEAIAQAGANAARRDKAFADTVRDMGHTAPAEREYHGK